jgi:hypothetical protein
MKVKEDTMNQSPKIPGSHPEQTMAPGKDAGKSPDGEFAHWLDEKTEALKFRLGEEFAVPPTALASPSVHLETSEQDIEEVLLEHETPGPQFLEELSALHNAPPLLDEELSRQALEDGGADLDRSTPE